MATKSTAHTKNEMLLKLLRSNNGASIPQLQKATGWQPHSVRGFLSGVVKKRLGLPLKSHVSKSGERRYTVTGN